MDATTALPARLRADLDALASDDPGWRGWQRLVERATSVAVEPAWQSLALAKTNAVPPLLQHARLTLPESAVACWLEEVLATAGIARDVAGDRGALLASAADGGLTLADTLAIDIQRATALADLLARPLLLAAGARLRDETSTSHDAGWCPVCGAWASLAEVRGLDRARHLRCARCAADWRLPSQRCPFCDSRDHRRLGALVPAGDAERRWVETCEDCFGYLKHVAALGPLDTALADLATVDLDVVALERGYRRPGNRPLRLEVVVDGA